MVNKWLASLVRKRRRHLGWSQSDLARAAGSSPSRICKLEARDDSVATNLLLKALEAMETPLRIEVDSQKDPFQGLAKGDRRQLSQRLLRRKHAEQIARRENVDAGDVEHVLYNLSLRPWDRLGRSFERAGLKRFSTKRL